MSYICPMANQINTPSYQFDRDFISRLTDMVDGPAFIQRYIKLKRVGKRHVGICPFHSDSKPSLYIWENGNYHCFGCQKHGDIFSFVTELNGVSFTDAVKEVASFAGVPLPEPKRRREIPKEEQELYDILEECAKFFENNLNQSSNNSRVVRYLTERGLTPEVVRKYRIGFAPDAWTTLKDHFKDTPAELLIKADVVLHNSEKDRSYDRFRNRLIFPIRNRFGYVVGFGGRALGEENPKYLNSSQTPVFFKARELYGLHETLQIKRRPDRILLTEGYMDVVGLSQYGIEYAIATLGTASNSSHFKQAFWHTSELVCCFDGDEAGRKAANQALKNALPELNENRNIRFMFLPDGEDPDSLVRQIGKDEFEQRIQESQHLADYFVSVVNESKSREFPSLEIKYRFIQRASELIATVQSPSMQELLRQEVAKCFEDVEGIRELLSARAPNMERDFSQEPPEPPYPIQDEFHESEQNSTTPRYEIHRQSQLRLANFLANPKMWPLLDSHLEKLNEVFEEDPEEAVVKVCQAVIEHNLRDYNAVIAYFQSDKQFLYYIQDVNSITTPTKQPADEVLRDFLDSMDAMLTSKRKPGLKLRRMKEIQQRVATLSANSDRSDSD